MTEHNSNFPNGKIFFRIFEKWKNRCLIDNKNLFLDSEVEIWTKNNVDQLLRIFGDKSQLKSGKVDELFSELIKLIEPTTDDCKLFVAEISYILRFSVDANDTTVDTKRTTINLIVKATEYDRKEFDQELFEDEVLMGFANTGNLYGSKYFYSEIKYCLNFLSSLFESEKKIRRAVLGDSRDLTEWLESIPDNNNRQFRHLLLFMLFPDEFQPIFTKIQRRNIVGYYRSDFDFDNSSQSMIDKELNSIENQLCDREGKDEIDFFAPPISEEWNNQSKNGDSTQPGKSSEDKELDSKSDHCNLNTIFYGPPGTGKTYATFEKCVEICDGKATDATIKQRYKQLRDEDKRIEFVTFHQSYSYEEFVEGLRPESSEGGGFKLKVKNGVLKRIANRARQNPREEYVLVIDEINRANISKVLGELITLLEEDKREGQDNEISVTLPYSDESFVLPNNLHILGTMNTADRSIALLDTALRRRFSFEEIPPNPMHLEGIGTKVGIDLPQVLQKINERLEWFTNRDHQIGHAWFMEKDIETKEQIDNIMRNKIIPQIVEYFYEDWEKVRSVLGGGNYFIERIKLNPPPGDFDNTEGDRFSWSIKKKFKRKAYDHLIGEKKTPETAAE